VDGIRGIWLYLYIYQGKGRVYVSSAERTDAICKLRLGTLKLPSLDLFMKDSRFPSSFIN
jgi:hypothetical protein